MAIIIVWAILSWVCAMIAAVFLVRTRRLRRQMDEMAERLTMFRSFYEWGATTRVVVRDKQNHADAKRITVWEMWETFEKGDAFENAMMLFQNTDFKVYAQGKKAE
jgi:hypothetical protein